MSEQRTRLKSTSGLRGDVGARRTDEERRIGRGSDRRKRGIDRSREQPESPRALDLPGLVAVLAPCGRCGPSIARAGSSARPLSVPPTASPAPPAPHSTAPHSLAPHPPAEDLPLPGSGDPRSGHALPALTQPVLFYRGARPRGCLAARRRARDERAKRANRLGRFEAPFGWTERGRPLGEGGRRKHRRERSDRGAQRALRATREGQRISDSRCPRVERTGAFWLFPTTTIDSRTSTAISPTPTPTENVTDPTAPTVTRRTPITDPRPTRSTLTTEVTA
jgi:hypothetical protein